MSKRIPTTLREAAARGYLYEADDEAPLDDEGSEDAPLDPDAPDDEPSPPKPGSVIPPENEVGTEKFMDDEITSMLIDFESAAIQSATVNNEASRYKLSRFLFEEARVPNIDMERFASDVARLIKNYDSLLDIPAFIIGRAKAFIIDRYSDELASELEEVLEIRHDIVLEPDEDAVPDAPIAVGATEAGGGVV